MRTHELHAPDFPDQFARTRRFSLGLPQRVTVSPDGSRVLFVRTTAGDDPVSRLWLLADGRERVLADPSALGAASDASLPEAERVRRERARETASGVVAYATDAGVRLAAFALGGELWVVGTDGSAARRVGTAGPVVDPRPSPDGTWIAYVSGGALRLVRSDGSGDRPLAVPEAPEVSYGLPEHAAAESMGRTRGYWWAPDSAALLVARVDTAPVGRLYVTDPAEPARPPRSAPYAMAGTANARVSLLVARVDGTRVPVALPTEAPEATHPRGAWTDRAFEYVAAAEWDAHGPTALVQTRDQRTTQWLAVDPATGASEVLGSRRDAAWVPLVPGVPSRTASGTPVWTFTGEDDLERLAVGDARSPAGLQVREVFGSAGERVYFQANGEEPTEIHVWYHDPASGFVRLSEGPGVHAAVGFGDDTVVLESTTWSGRTVTVRSGGKDTGRIAVRAQEPVVTPRPSRLVLGGRALRSHLHLPSWYEEGAGPLPVLLNPYAGPNMQLVVEARSWWSTVSQWFAEQGFAVLVTDGRGTSGRGRAWDTAIHGDRLTPALEDQIDALRAAAGLHPGLDLSRVAIRGWSYGGYLAAGAVLRHPEVFHAAVAGGAPTDRRLYDTHWEERFLGHPELFPGAYDRSSLLADAHRLRRPLLLVHGLVDDNVHVAHALRLSAALLEAGREHSVLPLPGTGHLVTRREQMRGLLLRELEFLARSLDL
ncbi:prolyl oligopeptidase family serine peptidase [Streptomyces sp. NPDC057638]|uniref:S9 family peptidase n=1 Tax=Streptomyces sp. NPDC057638 TaxID=3346190 RepID=UPI003688BF29